MGGWPIFTSPSNYLPSCLPIWAVIQVASMVYGWLWCCAWVYAFSFVWLVPEDVLAGESKGRSYMIVSSTCQLMDICIHLLIWRLRVCLSVCLPACLVYITCYMTVCLCCHTLATNQPIPVDVHRSLFPADPPMATPLGWEPGRSGERPRSEPSIYWIPVRAHSVEKSRSPQPIPFKPSPHDTQPGGGLAGRLQGRRKMKRDRKAMIQLCIRGHHFSVCDTT